MLLTAACGARARAAADERAAAMLLAEAQKSSKTLLTAQEEAAMKAVVDQDLCTGCGLCPETCPEVFDMAEDTAIVKVDVVPADAEASCREAAEGCPVEAISIE